MTVSLMTFRISTLSIMIIGIMESMATLIKMALSISSSVIMLSVILLSVSFLS
jgi:hypothetical protein